MILKRFLDFFNQKFSSIWTEILKFLNKKTDIAWCFSTFFKKTDLTWLSLMRTNPVNNFWWWQFLFIYMINFLSRIEISLLNMWKLIKFQNFPCFFFQNFSNSRVFFCLNCQIPGFQVKWQPCLIKSMLLPLLKQYLITTPS